jgi:hypothetical protein
MTLGFPSSGATGYWIRILGLSLLANFMADRTVRLSRANIG